MHSGEDRLVNELEESEGGWGGDARKERLICSVWLSQCHYQAVIAPQRRRRRRRRGRGDGMGGAFSEDLAFSPD